MSAIRMDGTALAAKVKEEVRTQAEGMPRKPGLAIVLVGDDPASRVYAGGKRKDCTQCGFYSEEYVLPAQISQKELLDLIQVLNGREEIDGILIEQPLPGHLNAREVLWAVSPDKDVDCFHPYSVGLLTVGAPVFCSCTPAGVMRLLEGYGISPAGKHCVIVGRSNVVGKPLALLMLQADATVSVCHTRTADLKAECLRADILVTAAGRAGLVTGDMIKPGAVVVDVAVNQKEDGSLRGDVVFEEAAERAAYITPVPGGVGPMTRAMVLENTLRAAKLHGK